MRQVFLYPSGQICLVQHLRWCTTINNCLNFIKKVESVGTSGGSGGKTGAPYTEAVSSLQLPQVQFHQWPFAACHSPSLSLSCFLSTLQLSYPRNKGRRIRLAGHCLRHPEHGHRSRGRPTPTFVDVLKNDAGAETTGELARCMENGEDWKRRRRARLRTTM